MLRRRNSDAFFFALMAGNIGKSFYLCMIMAKGFGEIDSLCRELVQDARRGVFKPVYLLMGDEPYYVDMVCDAILEHCLDESERDFNQTICYGADVDADTVITAARRYPMFAERQLVVVKEAQMMKKVFMLMPTGWACVKSREGHNAKACRLRNHVL